MFLNSDMESGKETLIYDMLPPTSTEAKYPHYMVYCENFIRTVMFMLETHLLFVYLQVCFIVLKGT